MPKLAPDHVPSYRLHKQSGGAIVTLSGKDHLLGKHGSKESRATYDRLIAEWLANGRRADYRQVKGLTVSRILAEFTAHARTYYVGPDGKPTGELPNFKAVMVPLRHLYGATPAAEFGPRALKALQQELIRLGWVRTYINRQIVRVRQIFGWAVAQELIPASTLHGLEALDGLRVGKTEAPEAEPVRPVPAAWVEATLPYVSRQVQALIELQHLTGMRPGEVVRMRGVDMDAPGPIWVYRPPQHKTAHHGHARDVYLGPKARNIVEKFLKPCAQAYLFSPRAAARLTSPDGTVST